MKTRISLSQIPPSAHQHQHHTAFFVQSTIPCLPRCNRSHRSLTPLACFRHRMKGQPKSLPERNSNTTSGLTQRNLIHTSDLPQCNLSAAWSLPQRNSDAPSPSLPPCSSDSRCPGLSQELEGSRARSPLVVGSGSAHTITLLPQQQGDPRVSITFTG